MKFILPILFVILFTDLQAQITDGVDVRIYPSGNSQTEVSIAINKKNPSNLVASSNTLINQGYYVTQNGGATWFGSDQLQNDNGVAGDPWTAFDANGKGYISSLTPEVSQNGNFSPDGYYVQSSTNGGSNWSALIRGRTPYWGVDKDAIAADNYSSSPFVNNFYCAWSNFNSPSSVQFNRSTDGGSTFSTPINLQNSIGQGTNVQTGKNGEVYVCWANPSSSSGTPNGVGIGFASSANGGVSFSAATVAFPYSGTRDQNGGDSHYNNIRINDFPSMAVDKNTGRIYIVYPTKQNGNGKSIVQIRYSEDKGITWSSGITISSSAFTESFFPSVTVDDLTGEVYVVYYAFDNPNSAFSTNTYVAYSNDRFTTFSNILISDVPHITSPDPNYLYGYTGDYISIAAYGGYAYAAWMDNRNGTNQIYVSKSTSLPRIASVIPLFGKNGTPVTINGGGFNTTAANNAVYFGAVKASVTSASSSQLQVTTPAGATSLAQVTVTDVTRHLSAISPTSAHLNFDVTFPGSVTSSTYNRTDYAVAGGPYGVATGDFNGDGKVDYATINVSSGTLSVVYRNSTNNGFLAPVNFAVGTTPAHVVAADFNGDGLLDIAVSNGDNTSPTAIKNSISVLIRKSDNSDFNAAINYPTSTDPDHIVAQDFNSDGLIDIAVATSYNPTGNTGVAVLLRNSTNDGFLPYTSLGGALNPLGLASADFNGDGQPDLVLTNFASSNVWIYLRNPTNTGFNNNVTVVTTSANPREIAAGDVNGDGFADLVIAHRDINLVSILYRNSTNTGFLTPITIPVGTSPYGVRIGDFNGDGKPDIAVGHQTSNNVAVILRSADNSGFVTPIYFASGGAYTRCIALGDFNSDGRQDIIAANETTNNTSVFIYTDPPTISSISPLSNPVGTPVTINGGGFNTTAANNAVYFGAVKASVTSASSSQLQVTTPAGATSLAQVTVTDVTRHLSAISPTSAHLNFDVTFPGSVTSSTYNRTDYAVAGGPYGVATGDFNGDGKVDYATINVSSGTLSVVYRNSTNNGFLAPVNFAVGTTPAHVVAADFNGDGLLDIAVSNGDNTSPTAIKNSISVLIRKSDNSDFNAAINYPTSTDPDHIVAQDFNSDGLIDIAVATSYNPTGNTGVAVLLRNSTNDGFLPYTSLGGALNPLGLASADFNGDGQPDLVLTNFASSNVWIYLRNPTNTGFNNNVTVVTTSANPREIAAGDVNGDGFADLVIAHRDINLVSILYRNSTNTGFLTPITIPVGTSPYGVRIGDFNGDGKPDIAVGHQTSNNVAVILRSADNSGFVTPIYFASGGAYTRCIALGDFNSDGRQDIIAANETTNNTSVFIYTPTGGGASITSTVVDASPIKLDQSDSLNNEEVAVYPNPTNGLLKFSGLIEGNSLVTIIDMNGVTRTAQQINSLSPSLLLNELEPGFYVVSFESYKGIVKKKILVK